MSWFGYESVPSYLRGECSFISPSFLYYCDDLWTQSEKILDNTSVDHLGPVLASPMLSYAEQGQSMDGWLEHYIGSFRNKGRTGSSLDFKSLNERWKWNIPMLVTKKKSKIKSRIIINWILNKLGTWVLIFFNHDRINYGLKNSWRDGPSLFYRNSELQFPFPLFD
jgi:hypothetical protein